MSHPQTRAHHLALGARDPAALASFYAETFALSEVARHLDDAGEVRSIWLDLGGEILLMIERAEGHRAPHPAAPTPGWFLLALRPLQPTLDDGLAWLAAHDIPVESRTGFTLYVRDPEGNRVALSWYVR